jgi:aldose 1-epimerase
VDSSKSYFGCVVGRVANRIQGAEFEIPASNGSSTRVKLEANDDAKHALHGGSEHWGKKRWDARVVGEEHSPAFTYSLRSPDGDAEYPGEVTCDVTYRLEKAEKGVKLRVTMSAQTSKDTPINLVQHTHWNLSGHQLVSKVCSIAGVSYP